MIAALQQQVKPLEDIIHTLREERAKVRGGPAPASTRRPALAAVVAVPPFCAAFHRSP